MSTQVSNPRLDLPLLASRQLFLLFIAAHLSAGVAMLLLDIEFWWRLFAWLLIGLHAAYVWRDITWIRKVQSLQYYQDEFYISTRGGKQRAVAERGHFVTPWLTILCLRLDGKRRFLPLFRDSGDADNLRRLRVLLRCRV